MWENLYHALIFLFWFQCWFELSEQKEQNLNIKTLFSQTVLILDKNHWDQNILNILAESITLWDQIVYFVNCKLSLFFFFFRFFLSIRQNFNNFKDLSLESSTHKQSWAHIQWIVWFHIEGGVSFSKFQPKILPKKGTKLRSEKV